MFVIVAGCGRLGAGLASLLSARGNDVVVVSRKIDLKWLGPEFDGVTVEGDPADGATLESAGIRKAGLFVAATSDDVVNAMAVQLAKRAFGVPMAIARMTDPVRERFYRSLGLETVCPTTTGINQIMDAIHGSEFASLEGALDPELAGVEPPEDWLGKRVAELSIPRGRRVVGLERGGRILDAPRAGAVARGDVLILRKIRAEEATA
jgi:trk system potassium uptake protein